MNSAESVTFLLVFSTLYCFTMAMYLPAIIDVPAISTILTVMPNVDVFDRDMYAWFTIFWSFVLSCWSFRLAGRVKRNRT